MYDTEENKYHTCTRDNLLNCRQPHQNIHLKENKQVLQCTNLKMLLVKRDFYLLKISGENL